MTARGIPLFNLLVYVRDFDTFAAGQPSGTSWYKDFNHCTFSSSIVYDTCGTVLIYSWLFIYTHCAKFSMVPNDVCLSVHGPLCSMVPMM